MTLRVVPLWRRVLEGLPEERSAGQTSARSVSKYTLLEGMTAKNQGLFLKGDQVQTVTAERKAGLADGGEAWKRFAGRSW